MHVARLWLGVMVLWCWTRCDTSLVAPNAESGPPQTQIRSQGLRCRWGSSGRKHDRESRYVRPAASVLFVSVGLQRMHIRAFPCSGRLHGAELTSVGASTGDTWVCWSALMQLHVHVEIDLYCCPSMYASRGRAASWGASALFNGLAAHWELPQELDGWQSLPTPT